jgi:4-diphosphocytidyl-2-C-methyl-D-erythritol kinase
MSALSCEAPAKVNLTLRVLGRRADGRHELASIVAFAATGDRLALVPGAVLDLAVNGPMAAMAGAAADNLVLKAARAFAERVAGARLGRFELTKILPAGAGLGGGSADAAAALRLLARANDLAPDDSRIAEAARATGADVPVCLDPRARLMHGIGEIVSPPLELPVLDAVLVFPGTPLATAAVFGRFAFKAARHPYSDAEIPREHGALIEFLQFETNDLEPAARELAPAISAAAEALGRTAPLFVRMTGSGSALFGLYDGSAAATVAAENIRTDRPNWWVAATRLR